MQRTHPSERTRLTRGRAPAHGFRPGEILDNAGHHLGDDLLGIPARLLNHRDIELALLGIAACLRLIDRGEPRTAQKTFDGLFRRIRARPLALFPYVGGTRSHPAQVQREAARRPVFLRALIGQPGIDQRIGDALAQILRRTLLHARGNFLTEKFKQKIRHRTFLRACLSCLCASSLRCGHAGTRVSLPRKVQVANRACCKSVEGLRGIASTGGKVTRLLAR